MTSYLYPGVYIEEIPSGSKPIEGVATSNAVFIGYTTQGPIGEAELIHQWDEYVDTYGGVKSSTDAMGLAVSTFYLNGGKNAYIARLAANAATSKLPAAKMLGRSGGSAQSSSVLNISAKSPGAWGNSIHVKVTDAGDGYYFKLEIGFVAGGRFSVVEVFDGLCMNEKDSNYVLKAVNSSSKQITVDLSDSLKSTPDTYFLNGYSVSADLSGITWTNVKAGMKLTLDVDGLGARTITLPKPQGRSYNTVSKVRRAIQKQVRALGSQSAYLKFTVTFAANTLTLTSGTKGSSSSVVVHQGELANLLKLGISNSGTERHGTYDVVPKTMGNEVALAGGEDGDPPGLQDYKDFYAKLKKIRDASIMLLPGQVMPADGSGNTVIDAAIAHCESMKNRMLIIDPPPGYELAQAGNVSAMNLTTSTYAALYYPWVQVRNPFYNPDTNATVPTTLNVAPSSIAAGIWARIDGTRGVWNAPAGLECSVRGLVELEYNVDDGAQDQLNPLGVNCIRRLPNYGTVIWGARTLATKATPEWRYLPVRRTAIYIEQSVYNGIQWAVFEPNDQRLWASLRSSIGNFMNGLFRVGAFHGEKASDAYFVRCGLGDTMTQNDIDRGQVIVDIGFAPLKPAEFVIVRIQQKVNQQ